MPGMTNEDNFLVECPVCGEVSEWIEEHPRRFVRTLSKEAVLAELLRGVFTCEWTCLECHKKLRAAGMKENAYEKAPPR